MTDILSLPPEELDLSGLEFTDAELDLLRERGLLRGTDEAPWRPETLGDVDWVGWKLKSLDAEIAAIRSQAERRIERLTKARESFAARYLEACQGIVEAHLPRNPKTGKITAKYLDLDTVRVGIRKAPGGPRIRDEAEVLRYVFHRWRQEGHLLPPSEVLGPLVDAVRLTLTYTGNDALILLDEVSETEGGEVKILAGPVKAHVKSLPPVPDPETGEALPATIPGVEIAPETERFYIE